MRFDVLPLGIWALSVSLTIQLAAQTALDELENRLESESPPPVINRSEAAQQGYLGLFAHDARDGLAGVVVVSVNEKSPAANAGLLPGDNILTVDLRVLATTGDLAASLAGKKAGEKIILEIARAGRRQRIEVVLGRQTLPAPALANDAPVIADAEREATPWPSETPAILPDYAASGHAVLGVSVVPVTSEARVLYGVAVRRGALISAVYDNLPAANAGLAVGSVVVAVDGRYVDSPADLVARLNGCRPGDQVEITYYAGNRPYRSVVQLAPAPAVIDSQPSSHSVPPDRLPGQIPALGRIENMIDGLVPPTVTHRIDPESKEVSALRTQVESLQTELSRLRQRLADVEKQLGSQ